VAAERRRSRWRNPDFMKLWTAESISQLSSIEDTKLAFLGPVSSGTMAG
jgi:hypothetical protein